ncbi:unnamed protein product [Schistosoma mattheei]|uniref:B5 domain-containing protein n=1 Tax=Schistosoma mattheei TaxID=31246 RepID=A0A3P8GJ05_9TREM|nr:unnamed protein product [Schistosoma mattheei]
MKRGRAAGPDGLAPEIFKDGGPILAITLTNILTKIWESDVIPSDWSQSLIVPIYKKGSKSFCDNHRGISLTNIISKILASIIIRCLTKTRELQTREDQAGFRPGHGCIDHIFTIREHSRISTKTRNVFIEATGTDLHKAIVVLDTLITMFSEYCEEPFTAESVEVIQHDGSRFLYPRLDYRDEVVSIDYINRQLGTNISETEVINLLNRMGFTCTTVSSNQCKDSTSDILTPGNVLLK